MMKRYIAGFILMAVFLSSSTIQVFADDSNRQIKEKEEKVATIGEIGGYLEGNIRTVENLKKERKFRYDKGHGFAAERGNNLYDALQGKKATIFDDNAKDGPDRKIINRNGTVILIQDKYHKTARASVNNAFDQETELYRYMDAEGKPMQLEVPADQYDKAVKVMAEKIQEEKVPGVADPQEASSIVKKGKLTWQQAKNLTKAGNIDSLKYDAANGTIIAVGAMGISFAIDFALCKLNGQNHIEALKNASLNGLKTGGAIFATYVISSQLAKTGLASAMAPTTDAIANSLGRGLSEAILQAYGVEVANMASKEIAKQISKLLQSQIITSGVLVVVLSADDVIDLFRGRISKEQLLQNLVVTIMGTGGMLAGTVAGGAVGTFIAPGAGTAVGSVTGGILGGTAAGFVAQKGQSAFLESDADKMYEILSAKFNAMCFDYMLNEKEVNEVVDELKSELSGSVLKDMYQSEDREKFAEDLMRPIFETKVASREKIEIPTEEETRLAMLSMLNGIVFVH